MNIALFYGALLGLTSVIMGAAGDHLFLLQGHDADIFQTALRYNALYAILIVALSFHTKAAPKRMKASLLLFCLGTTLFCGSLYASLSVNIGSFIYFTPLGGITLMAGWIALLLAAWKR
jgi:uncharacterized membrane protein YgdD (TMEM256/DUF423 family)